MALIVNEIFYSIQGESSFAGRPCVFVRLTGCNLRCAYCDTQYAYDKGQKMHIPLILDRVADYACPLVEITGGEPLLQAQTPDLIYALLEKKYRVLLETNGTLDVRWIDPRCVKIIDIKCPSSGEHKKNRLENLDHITPGDEIKMVIGDRTDYEYAKGILKNLQATVFKENPVHFSPVYEKIPPETLARWLLEDHLGVSLHLQLHKILWGPDKKGV